MSEGKIPDVALEEETEAEETIEPEPSDEDLMAVVSTVEEVIAEL
jgi:hypothetical protein